MVIVGLDSEGGGSSGMNIKLVVGDLSIGEGPPAIQGIRPWQVC